jgi:spore germination protein GerM
MCAFIAGVSALVACGVPIDDSVRSIDSVPWQLMATTTSTTTTTTTSTIPVASTIAQTSTTTTTLVDLTTESVQLYFVSGDRFVEERRIMPLDASLEDVLVELIRGSLEPVESSFPVTVVNVGDVLGVVSSEGVATVELSPRFNDLVAAEQRKLVGQLVLTLGSQKGIGQVAFTVNGNQLDVPQGDGTFGPDALSRESFLSLVDGPPESTTTSTVFSLSPDDIIGATSTPSTLVTTLPPVTP